jgi:MFS family permease
MRRLITHRDARIYIAGQSFSIIGDSALWLAMGIWVKILTGSNSAAGLTFFAFVCGCMTAPLSGVVVDRLRRRPLLIAANLSGAALVCVLLLVHGRGQVWLIYAVMFGYGAVNGLITAAQTALLTVLVPGDLLGEANSALQMLSQGLRLVTPLLGAGLLALAGARPVILLDAGTFAAAAAAVLALRLREQRPDRAPARWRAEFTAGLRHVADTRALRRPLIACVIAVSAFGFFETVPFAVVGQGLHRSPEFLGVLNSLQGAGALIGGALAAPVMRRTSERALMAGGLAACAAAGAARDGRGRPVRGLDQRGRGNPDPAPHAGPSARPGRRGARVRGRGAPGGLDRAGCRADRRRELPHPAGGHGCGDRVLRGLPGRQARTRRPERRERIATGR